MKPKKCRNQSISSEVHHERSVIIIFIIINNNHKSTFASSINHQYQHLSICINVLITSAYHGNRPYVLNTQQQGYKPLHQLRQLGRHNIVTFTTTTAPDSLTRTLESHVLRSHNAARQRTSHTALAHTAPTVGGHPIAIATLATATAPGRLTKFQHPKRLVAEVTKRRGCVRDTPHSRPRPGWLAVTSLRHSRSPLADPPICEKSSRCVVLLDLGNNKLRLCIYSFKIIQMIKSNN